MSRNLELGRAGEAYAVAHLEELGYDVIERNWHCKYGEVDVVARDGGALACVEVKTRSSLFAGHPLESITPLKLSRMRRVASAWAAANPQHRGSIRLDVISIVLGDRGCPVLRHVQGVGW